MTDENYIFYRKINSFGGVNFADSIISSAKLNEVINQELGSRGERATYSYADIIRSYFLMSLCGGECAEDVTENLRGELERVWGGEL